MVYNYLCLAIIFFISYSNEKSIRRLALMLIWIFGMLFEDVNAAYPETGFYETKNYQLLRANYLKSSSFPM